MRKNVKLSIASEKKARRFGFCGVNAVPRAWGRFCVLSTLFALAASGCARIEPPPQPQLGPVVPEKVDFAKIGSRYHIRIVTADPVFPVKTRYGKIEGKRAATDELDRYAPLFSREFTLYPTDLIHRSGLKRVVLCKGLSFAGQLRGAIPDFEHDSLYLDVVRGRFDPLYLCKVIHHEFFHMIDYRDDGRLYEDNHWSALNPSPFKYGTGGENAQRVLSASKLTDKFPGFLNYYSTTGVEEDKAELFANMIVNPKYVENRSRTDGVLKAKVLAMKELAMRFCPDVNEKFWEKTRKTDRPGNGSEGI